MKKYINYLIPSIITFIIMMIIFYFNELYPFGNNSLLQVDSDFIYIPSLYKLYDILHGNASIFYTDLGFGNSIYGALIIQRSLFSPLNLLLYFVNRSNIIKLNGLFITIKLCLISLTSYIYINKKYFKVDYFYKVLFSILYTFNGFVILNYYNEIWLEFVILFPLIVMYLDKVLNNKSELGYIIVLSLALIISFYYGLFILVFIILYTAINLYIDNKKDTKEIIFKLGKSTLIALLISSFSSVPLLYQIFNSSRYNTPADITMFSNFTLKSLHLLFSPLFITMFIKLVIKYKKDKKNILKYILLIGLYLIPIVFDPINALMHGGSYWYFPYRYGFIPLFILCDASLYYISKFSQKNSKKINFETIGLCAIVLLLCVLGVILNYNYHYNIIYEEIFLKISNTNLLHILYMLVLIFLAYLTIYFIKNNKIKKIMLLVVSLYSTILITSWTIYYNDLYLLSRNAQKIYEERDFSKNERYKIDYFSHTPYYGYIINIDSLDNWIHLLPNKEAYINLGYYHDLDILYGYGGTIFSDWLLNFKNILSIDKKNDDLFKKLDDFREKYVYIDKNQRKITANHNIYLYQYNYNQNLGVVFDKIDKSLIYNNELGKFDYQNKIYQNLFNKNDNIVEYTNYKFENKKITSINYEIDKEGYLYLCDYNDNIDYIIINGKRNDYFDNQIRYIGKYDRDVNLVIYFKDESISNFDIGFIKKESILQLNNLNSNVIYNNGKYYVNSDGEKYLFLPINNIDGTIAYNNGKKVETLKYLNNFICIKLNDGENVISIKYKMPLFNISICLSILGIILLIFNKKINNIYLINITTYLYKFIIVLTLIYYYIYSIIKYILVLCGFI